MASFLPPSARLASSRRPSPSFTVTPLIMHVHSTRNNTLISLSRLPHTSASALLPNTFSLPSHRLTLQSAGMQGFKKGQRETYEAGYQTALKVFEVVRRERAEWGEVRMEVRFDGWGQGREAVWKALMAQEGEGVRDTVVRLTDCTKLKIGGTRARKERTL